MESLHTKPNYFQDIVNRLSQKQDAGRFETNTFEKTASIKSYTEAIFVHSDFVSVFTFAVRFLL